MMMLMVIGDGVMVMLVFWLWKPSHDFPSIWNSNLVRYIEKYHGDTNKNYHIPLRSSMMMIMMSVFWL